MESRTSRKDIQGAVITYICESDPAQYTIKISYKDGSSAEVSAGHAQSVFEQYEPYLNAKDLAEVREELQRLKQRAAEDLEAAMQNSAYRDLCAYIKKRGAANQPEYKTRFGRLFGYSKTEKIAAAEHLQACYPGGSDPYKHLDPLNQGELGRIKRRLCG